ncbi:hypothetical protein HZC53_01070 [Candidatus Uhrbacteria bacterium]|nr:hypothetical protein [Candidatus Uhrbacteria bacterium]
MINQSKPEITIPISCLLLALDYLEFLNQSWKRDERRSWDFIQPEARFNPHGFSAAKAKDVMRRFGLCWVPFHDNGFSVALVHRIVRAINAQDGKVLVPIRDLVEDIASTTHDFANAPHIFRREEFGDPNKYDFAANLGRFFVAFACEEIGLKDLV